MYSFEYKLLMIVKDLLTSKVRCTFATETLNKHSYKPTQKQSIMEITYSCPKCGEVLEKGQYWYDLESDTMRVDHCPECDCEYGEPCEVHDNE